MLHPLLSSNDTSYVSRALLEGHRLDGRDASTPRALVCALSRGERSASSEVTLGATRVVACVTGEISAPYEERPQDGFLVFNVEVLSSGSEEWADASGGGQRGGLVATHIARILERQIRDSRAIDMEALCIIPGERVWALRCDVRVVEDFGNLTDAASAAALSALLHFRRPEVTVRGGSVTVHPTWERPPVPLAVHHTPLTLTFACMALGGGGVEGGAGGDPALGGGEAGRGGGATQLLLRDPTLEEEAVSSGTVSLCMNAHGELCGLHKLGGCPISVASLLGLVKSAATQAPVLVAGLRNASGGE